MKVYVESVSVGDQDKALEFYTGVLGFVLRDDIDLGGGARWLTVASPEQPDGPLVLLEPNADYPPMKALKEQLMEDGIPFAMFEVGDIRSEHERLASLDVRFTAAPTDGGEIVFADLDDTCGNLIRIFQHKDTGSDDGL